ncbi:MAG: DUF885 family protein [Planctomycetia bacterium]|nr:DUF885 family protein [Planctomycetia bacterium]
MWIKLLKVLGIAMCTATSGFADESPSGSKPLIVAHRGLLKHAPENTLSNFRACLELRIGFEVDVRRSKDGHLVCVHDETVDRTTNGRGAVNEMTLDELKLLDAGSWFNEKFKTDRIPTFDEVLDVIAKHSHNSELIAIDLKAPNIEADCVNAAKAKGVLARLLFIGNTIEKHQVREKLKEADASAHVARLAIELQSSALTKDDEDWCYLRFLPTRDEVDRIHKAGKRAFIAGPTVVGIEHTNWQAALYAGVDGILTDYPLELAADSRNFAMENLPAATKANLDFDEAARQYIREMTMWSPISATTLGDHLYDHEVDYPTDDMRKREHAFHELYLKRLKAIDRSVLSRDNQVDYQLLMQQLQGDLWRLNELQEWAWNPVLYTQLTGNAVYGLMARDFAPVETRISNVIQRLERLPGFLADVRKTLDPKRVPPIHAETAIKQNRGVLSIIDNMVKPEMSKLSEGTQKAFQQVMPLVKEAIDEHQQWLEKELLPNAKGNFRIGAKLFDAKLAFSLGSGLSRPEVRDRAEFELRRVRKEMYSIARSVMLNTDPKREGEAPAEPSPEQQQAVITAALEKAYAEIPARDGIVDFAKKSLEMTTEFVRKHDLVTIPDDPLDIILMPEFQRGVSIAYCDSPGPLDVGQKTYYAVSPIPDDWTDKQVGSFLREYNFRSIHDLTIHEAMPGHFLQIAHSNRSSRRLRALLSSGTFVEGWGVYAEQLMSEEGFLDRDPLMRLIALKWYLRGIANAILDQAIHVDGMNREEAMRLMVHDTFQEEREAALKWVRAQLTSTQLSTYFVGYQEHRDLRTAAEKLWADKFTLKRYHDGTLSFGSPPVRFVKALLLDEPIPE